MKRFIIITFGIFILYSCNKEDYGILNYTPEDYIPNISLSGFVSSDSIYACLTHTQKRQFYTTIYELHDCNPPITENACNIDIYEDDAFFCTLTPKQVRKVVTGCPEDSLGYRKKYTHYYYTSDKKTNSNRTYSIRLNHPDYGEIKAITSLPNIPNVIIDTFYLMKNITIGSFQNNSSFDTLVRFVNITININDDVNNENYYLLGIDNYRDFLSFYFGENYYGFHISNPLFENEAASYHLFRHPYNIYFPGYLFSDKTFNGSSFKTELCIPVVDSTFTFSVSALSEEQYQYLLSSYNYIKAESDPFGKPISLYSNVSNKIGLFGGYYYKKHIINLK